MSVIGTLAVKVIADTQDYEKKMKKAQTTADRVRDKMKRIGGAMVGAGKMLTMGVTAPVIAAGIAVVNLASDYEESYSKVEAVFVDWSDDVIKWSETSATAMGVSSQEALEAAGTFGNLFTAMGMSKEEAFGMSTSLVELATDLASFNNLDPTEVFVKLRAGLTGETEGLKTLGVNINAVMVLEKARSMGLATMVTDTTAVMKARLKQSQAEEKFNKILEKGVYGTDEAIAAEIAFKEANEDLEEALLGTMEPLDAQAKALATNALIFEQTTTAQGDFARTSDGLANQTRIVKAQIKDLGIEMGQMLLPYALQLAEKIRELVERFMALDPEVKRNILVFLGIAAAIGPVLIILGYLVTAIGALMSPIGLVIVIIALLALAWKNNWGGIRDIVKNVWENHLKPIFETLKAWLEVAIPQAIEILKDFWENKLKPAIETVWKFIQDKIFPLFITLFDWLSTTIPEALQTLSDFWNNTLLPAIEAVWGFIEDPLIPLFEALWELFNVAGKLAIEGLVSFWTTKLLPSLTEIWEFIDLHLMPIFDTIWKFIVETLGPAISTLITEKLDKFKSALDSVKKAAGWLTDKIKTLVEWLKKISIPKQLESRSPSPFEKSIRGISGALDDLNQKQLPTFATQLAGVGGRQTNVNYYLAYTGVESTEMDITQHLDTLELMRK